MSTAGPNAPFTAANDTAVGAVNWGAVNEAKTSNNAYATVGVSSTVQSNYLKVTNFGFAVPSGATINGITVSIDRKSNGSGPSNYVKDTIVKLVKGGTVSGDDKADTVTRWPSTEATQTYGGAADLWGLTLTDTDVNASTFGVVLSATLYLHFGKNYPSAFVDYISITIDYTEGGGGGGLSIPVAMSSQRRRRM